MKQLTPEQETRLEEYYAEGLEIITCTDRADRPRAEKNIGNIYKHLNMPVPQFIWEDSPLACCLRINYLLEKEKHPQLTMDEWLEKQEKNRNKKLNIDTNFWGQLDQYWISIYNFCIETDSKEINDQEKEIVSWWSEIAQSCFLWYPYDTVCVISERPTVLSLIDDQDRKILHSDNGPAIAFADGWEKYYLNGVCVTKELVMTPSEQLDPELVLKEVNADVRREIVRKIGIERICHKLPNEILDKQDNYELLNIKLGDDRYRPYLKMLNPSVPELWHLEGVHPDCQTVNEALLWRNGISKSDVDDENGADWYQQGDVLIFPHGAKKFKSKPKVIT